MNIELRFSLGWKYLMFDAICAVRNAYPIRNAISQGDGYGSISKMYVLSWVRF